MSAGDLQKSCLRGLTAACSLINKGSAPEQKHPILQGPTNGTETTLVVQRPSSEKLIYAYRKVGQTNLKDWLYAYAQTRTREFSDISLDHLRITNLKTKQAYEILVFDEEGMLKDQRRFSALDTSKKNPRIGIVSCMNDALKDVADQIWPEFTGHNPDMILLLGDNVYADKNTSHFGPANPEILWVRYTQTRNKLPVFYIKTLIPTLATWDDHDFGRNGGDRTYEHREASRQVFFDFFPQEYKIKDYDQGFGVANSLKMFGAEWILMDNRFERSPNGANVSDETQWGQDNEKWLYKKLKSNPIPAFIAEGDQYFGGYHPFDSYERNHPESFKTFIKNIKTLKQPVVFLSGDRHLTEVIKVPAQTLGYQTYELTSSAIHSSKYPDAFIKNPSPNKIAGIAGEYNYMLVDLKKVEKRSLQFLVESFGLDNKKFYSLNLTVKK